MLHGAYGNRQVAIGDREFGTLYGAPVAAYRPAAASLSPIFDSTATADFAPVQALCRRYGINVIVVKASPMRSGRTRPHGPGGDSRSLQSRMHAPIPAIRPRHPHGDRYCSGCCGGCSRPGASVFGRYTTHWPTVSAGVYWEETR